MRRNVKCRTTALVAPVRAVVPLPLADRAATWIAGQDDPAAFVAARVANATVRLRLYRDPHLRALTMRECAAVQAAWLLHLARRGVAA